MCIDMYTDTDIHVHMFTYIHALNHVHTYLLCI